MDDSNPDLRSGFPQAFFSYLALRRSCEHGSRNSGIFPAEEKIALSYFVLLTDNAAGVALSTYPVTPACRQACRESF
jgi:hypothetical protein